MAIGDEDVAVARDGDPGRPIEEAWGVTRHSRMAQCHQNLAGGAEFDDHMALAIQAVGIGNPHIALMVDRDSVRKHEHACAEARQQLAGWIEVQDRRQRSNWRSFHRHSARTPRRSCRHDPLPPLSSRPTRVPREAGQMKWPRQTGRAGRCWVERPPVPRPYRRSLRRRPWRRQGSFLSDWHVAFPSPRF